MIQNLTPTGTMLRPDVNVVPVAYRDRLTNLFDTWDAVRARNSTLSLYYDMKNQIKDLGISIPESMIRVNSVVGWCKKAVDAHAVRSVLDGFAFEGADDGSLDELVSKNRLKALYSKLCRSQMVHGLAAMTCMEGMDGSPKVRAFSANQFAALWNKDLGRIDCGIVLLDCDCKGNPTRYVAHFDDAVLVIERDENDTSSHPWVCFTMPNDLGRPTMELFAYDPDLDRPLGHSLITPEVQGIVDKAMRDVFRMEVGAEFFTFPQRYVLGAADDLFSMPVDEDSDEEPASSNYAKFQAYIGAFLAISKDEDGDVPSVGQFAASPAENFTHVFENDAQRFSGATNVPLAQLGVLSNTYTSSDALSATNDPLILEVETMNTNNSVALEEIARMMMAIDQNKTLADLDSSQRRVQTLWRDPSMPTLSARADAWTKLASADPSIVGTEVYYEKIGLPKAVRDRLKAEKRANGAIAELNRISQALSVQAAPVVEEAQADDTE